MVVPGVNEPRDAPIFSCASCTTNCITPVTEIMDRRIGVAKAMLTTVHAYTTSQGIVDAVLTELAGRFDGLAIRAPVVVGSVADLTYVTKRETSVDEVNKIFLEETLNPRYNAVVGIVEEPVVSADIIGDKHAAVVDLGLTRVVGGDLVKIMAWYDNETGYAAQMVRAAMQVVG